MSTNMSLSKNSPTHSPQGPQSIWDDALIRRYDLAGPRYTSYPTAPQFNGDTGFSQWQQAITNSNHHAAPLSLYFHIPFCETVCYYCGCNKVITANKKRAEPYLQALHKEVELQANYVKAGRPVHQLHWGGGTPTYISDQQMTDLMAHIGRYFTLMDDDAGEYSIEIHPQSVNPQRMALLRQLGFNRVSLGVQDFDPDVQVAVNRFNSEAEVQALVEACKDLGFLSLSMDLIYGLPRQTVDSFRVTLDKVITMRPNRLSLFNYAHMPHLFKVQKQIDSRQLPEPQEKLRMLHNSVEQLAAAGYVYIGMDHFALPSDELAIAQQNGVLHRNFQGYATHGDCDLLAFGVSAINCVDNAFFQNEKRVEDYQQRLTENRLPIAKGIVLNDDDRVRRAVINQLICHFELNFRTIEQAFAVDFRNYFANELQQLTPLIEDGLGQWTDEGFRVLDTGRLLIRRICMIFDAYLQNCVEPNTPKYSRII